MPPQTIILASASPRRVELLKKLVPDFEIRATDIDETLAPGENAITATRRLALGKARAGFAPGSITIGADTLVTLDGRVYGKPRDKAEAREWLFQLAGKTHEVVTGWCVKTDDREEVGHDITRVTFRYIAFGEIEAYLAMRDPCQFAGGYAAQLAPSSDFIDEIDGDFETVIGLPTQALFSFLRPH